VKETKYAFFTCTRHRSDDNDSNDRPAGPPASDGHNDDKDSDMKRVNIQLEDDIHTKAKIIAVLKGVTLNDYLAKTVTEAVQRDKKVLENVPK